MAQGKAIRKTTMFRSYRVSMRTSMQTSSPRTGSNLEEDFDNMVVNPR